MVERITTRHVHVSWLVAVACVGVVIGVTAAQYADQGIFGSVGWLLSGTALFLFGAVRMRAWVVPLVLIGGCLIGIWRGTVAYEDSAAARLLIGKTVELHGVVSEDTDRNKREQTVLRIRDAHANNMKIGQVWVTVKQTGMIRRSDELTIRGKLSSGFGSFTASMYDADVVVLKRPEPGDIALEVRDWFAEGVRRATDEPESSLGLGYLLGQRRGLPDELDAALKAAGLTHIVVASGYNLTILVRFARRLFEKTSKYLSLVSAGSMIVGFIAVTGLSPSMSRAGLVAGLSLLAWYYGRRFHPLVLLPFAMAVTLVVQPSYAWGDIGWQLSFAAFAGVMIMAPLIHAYFLGDKSENPLRRILIETISAQLFTLPILLLSFGQFSIIAPIANLLILPLVPLAMILTFAAGTGALLIPMAAQAFGFPAQLLLKYMTATAQYVGGIPWATQELRIDMVIAVIAYAVLTAACLYMWRVTRLQLERTSLVE